MDREFRKRNDALVLWSAFVAAWFTASSAQAQAPVQPAKGPLRVHPTNPRYFTDGSGKAIYLTGSHTWNTLQDIGSTIPPPAFDFNAYLDFLDRFGHNFIRLWRSELCTEGASSKDPPRRYIGNHPWRRTGPGTAADGLPKFNFEQWNEEHFDRLRSRVQAAGKRGIYVSIMLFEGWGLRVTPSLWAGYPMNAANNVNGVNGDPDGDGRGLEVQMLQVDAITEIQRAYIRKVIDTVNDLDNVLYEISNESLDRPEILKWQEQMVKTINEYQAGKPQQHPVGMTCLVAFSVEAKAASNAALRAGPADWIAPGAINWGPGDDYSIDPPVATGVRVEFLDSDHTWNNACMTRTDQQRAYHAWVWKGFLRGYNSIYMDPLDLSQPDGVLEYAKKNAYAVVLARPAQGHTRAYAERMNLAAATPQNDLASTKYCLANPGQEYLMYLPDGGEATVDLSAAKGEMSVEWFNPRTGETFAGDKTDGGAKRTFQAPFDSDAVLYLHRH